MHRISPVPNMNGSPAHILVEQMMEVCHALEQAAKIMRQWQPHGRDYQAGGDYKADRAEFERRNALIDEMARQYESEAYSLSKNCDSKARCG